MNFGICPECNKEDELTTTVSTFNENGIKHSYQSDRKYCQKCLELKMWTSLICDKYERVKLWREFAESKGYDPKLLEFNPTYPKIVTVKDRIYRNNEYEQEFIVVGFRMNKSEYTGTIHVYKGNIKGMTLLDLRSGNKKYTRDGGINSNESKFIDLVETQIVPKLIKRIEPYILGKSWRHLGRY